MKSTQTLLKNFTLLPKQNLLDHNVIISKDNIVHTKRVNCPICGELCSYNGSSNKGWHIFSKGTNSFLKKGQQFCSKCKKTIQVEIPWLNETIHKINLFLEGTVHNLSDNLSEQEISDFIKNMYSITVSTSKIHSVQSDFNNELEELDFDVEIGENFYGYDEQYITVDGHRAYRLVFMDLSTNKIIYEKMHNTFSKKILIDVLREVFGDKVPEGFVTDMRIEYLSAFQAVFGKNIKLQYCIFHLNKLILKEYRDSLKVGKKVYWKLMHYYNLYTLFNIFYDRTDELEIIKNLMAGFETFKSKLTIEKVEYYAEKYAINIKNLDFRKDKVIEIIEKKLMKAFRKILHKKRLFRKRTKTTLKSRDKKNSIEMFEMIKSQNIIWPNKIQKRILKIEKNFDLFTASNGQIMTNNRLEGFFGSTVKKFRKKIKRTMSSFSGMLKRKRAKQEGVELWHRFSFNEIVEILGVVNFFSK